MLTIGLSIPLHHRSMEGQPIDDAEVQYFPGFTFLAVWDYIYIFRYYSFFLN